MVGFPDRPRIRLLRSKRQILTFGRLAKYGGRLWVPVEGGEPGCCRTLRRLRAR